MHSATELVTLEQLGESRVAQTAKEQNSFFFLFFFSLWKPPGVRLVLRSHFSSSAHQSIMGAGQTLTYSLVFE